MSKTLEALYDGSVLRPVEPLTLEPNTRVWIVIKIVPPTTDTLTSFPRTARSLNLDGPSDWSANLEDYLYGDNAQLHQRQETVHRIDALRERIFATYGEMPDSAALIREDRER